jgi:broad specificity phosphatase PhoE
LKILPFSVLLVILAGICLPDLSSGSSERLDAISALKSGGGVLMIRHANAPGSGDPANFKIDDCATQRNLDERGRAQARAIGKFLRHHAIGTVRLYSSQWCRCLETARLMNLGTVQPLPALNSFFSRPDDRERRIDALKAFLAEQPRDGGTIILVTHYVTIAAMTGKGVSSGEGVVLQLKNGSPQVVGRLNFDQ